MSNLGIDELVIAYVLVAALLLGLLIPARGAWRLKALAIITGTVFCIITYVSMPTLLGWPTEAELPREFDLVAGYIEHPDPVTKSEGAIYLWGAERVKGGRRGVPRAYQFPFAVELSEKVDKAIGKLRKNIAQAGKVEEQELAPGRAATERRRGQKSVNIEFYDVPAPSLPEK